MNVNCDGNSQDPHTPAKSTDMWPKTEKKQCWQPFNWLMCYTCEAAQGNQYLLTSRGTRWLSPVARVHRCTCCVGVTNKEEARAEARVLTMLVVCRLPGDSSGARLAVF